MIEFLWLILSWEQEQALGKVSPINQVPGHLGPIVTELLFGFLHCPLETAIWFCASLTYNRLLPGLFIVDGGLVFWGKWLQVVGQKFFLTVSGLIRFSFRVKHC